MEYQDFESSMEHLLAQRPGPAHRLRGNETWLYLHHTGLELAQHGWKLHVSSRAATFGALVERLVPALLDGPVPCSFKLARSTTVLTRLNNGHSSPATVGKAFTVYPPQDRVRELGLQLAELLDGWAGPRVLSDRAVAPTAPVYYRYGPFTRSWVTDEHARLITVIQGPNPDDEAFGALATMTYRQPSWVRDPFTGDQGTDGPAGSAAAAPELLGGHFRLVEGIFESGRGNVYRAVDERDGASVVVKQARALVDETDAAGDARLRVRNERRVLQALAGLDGIARFVDHFRHGPDEFLVTADAGRYNLSQDLDRGGRYAPAGSPAAARGARPLEPLARDLARILVSVHERGVLMRDLSPRNIVVADERVTLIDFGLSWYQGLHLPGGTPGYAPARQRRGEDPNELDDCFSLGMVLLYAESNTAPVTLGEDRETAVHQARESLHRRYGARPTGVMGAVADLLSLDERALSTLRRLAAGEFETVAAEPIPARRERLDPEAIQQNLLADLLDYAHRSITGSPGRSIAHDASLYSGAAGAGLELLHHLDRPGVRERVGQLARFAVRTAEEVRLPHGYLSGRTGVDVFLAQAVEAGIDVGDGYGGPMIPDQYWEPVGADLMIGAAGVGLGHLVLSEFGGGARHLEVARRCARAVCDGSAPGRTEQDDTLPSQAAVETSAGRAHGLAGTVGFLLYYVEATQDPEILAATRDRADLLGKRAESLLARLLTPYSAPIAVSWCQGMAGIGQTLLHAARVFAEPEFAALAGRIADASTEFLPYVSVTTQCCGLAGIGNTLIDVAVHGSLADDGGDDGGDGGGDGSDGGARWAAAEAAAEFLLLRGAGTRTHPILVADSAEDGAASWAFGNAGLLGFFRRLAARGGPWSLPMPETVRAVGLLGR